MEKIKFSDYENFKNFSKKSMDELHKIIENGITTDIRIGISFFNRLRIVWTILFWISFLFIVGGPLLVMAHVTGNDGFAFVSIGIGLFIQIITQIIGIFKRRKKKAVLLKVMENISRQNLVKFIIESNFSNVKAPENLQNFWNLSKAKIYHTGNIPNNAEVKAFLGGQIFKVDESIFLTSEYRWFWSSGRRTYFRDNVYFELINTNPYFENFTFYTAKSKRNSSKLENETFNEKIKFIVNDDVKFRMVFTPSVQERFLKSQVIDKTISNFKSNRFWIFKDKETLFLNLFSTKQIFLVSSKLPWRSKNFCDKYQEKLIEDTIKILDGLFILYSFNKLMSPNNKTDN